MKPRPRISALMLALLAGSAVLPARPVGAGAGATQSEFLKIGLSARAAAMGGAFGAIADDLGALEYNPAGLGLLTNSQVSFMYSRWLAEINFGSFAGAHIVPALGTIGVAVNVLDLGQIEGTTVASFRASSFLVRAAWARTLISNLTIGAGAKVLNESISEFSSSGGTVDAGAIWTPRQGMNLALVAMNLGVVSAFESEKDSLPMLIKGAVAWKALEGEYGQLIAAMDLDYFLPPAALFNPVFGVEYWGGRSFALRAGYAVRDTDLAGLTGLTAGIGVRWQALRVDYAFAPFGSLGQTHRVALNWEIWPLVSLPVPGAGVGEPRTAGSGGPLPPAPPFAQAEAGEGSALLKWDAPEISNLLGYNVYVRREGARDWKKYNDEPVTGVAIIVGGLDANARYHFVVKSVDDAKPPRESVASPQATTIPY